MTIHHPPATILVGMYASMRSQSNNAAAVTGAPGSSSSQIASPSQASDECEMQKYLCGETDIDGVTPLCSQISISLFYPNLYVHWPTVKPRTQVSTIADLAAFIADGKNIKRSAAYQPPKEDELKGISLESISDRQRDVLESRAQWLDAAWTQARTSRKAQRALPPRWLDTDDFPHFTVQFRTGNGSHMHLSYKGAPALSISHCGIGPFIVAVDQNSPLRASLTSLLQLDCSRRPSPLLQQHLQGVVDGHEARLFVNFVESQYQLPDGSAAPGFVGLGFGDMELGVRKSATVAATGAQPVATAVVGMKQSKKYMESLMSVPSSRYVRNEESRVTMPIFDIIVINGESGCGKTFEAFGAVRRFKIYDPDRERGFKYWGIYMTPKADWAIDGHSATEDRDKAVIAAVVDAVISHLTELLFTFTADKTASLKGKLNNIKLVLAFDEMGGHLTFVRGLISSKNQLLEALQHRIRIADLFLAIAGTGVKVDFRPPGTLPQRYGLIDTTTPLEGFGRELIRHFFPVETCNDCERQTLQQCLADDTMSVNLCANARIAYHFVEALARAYRPPIVETSTMSPADQNNIRVQHMMRFFSCARDAASECAMSEYRRTNAGLADKTKTTDHERAL